MMEIEPSFDTSPNENLIVPVTARIQNIEINPPGDTPPAPPKIEIEIETRTRSPKEGKRYGPKSSQASCKKCSPRVGNKYQAIEGLLLQGDADDDEIRRSGMQIWNPHKLDEAEVDRYLLRVQQFIPYPFTTGKTNERCGDTHFSEERALFLLHLCEYDTDHVYEVLKEKCGIKRYVSSSECEEESSVEDDDGMAERMEDFQELGNECFVCGDGGKLLICEAKGCEKVYHPACLDLKHIPKGTWSCPWHFCCQCKSPAKSVFTCSYCPNAYCILHADKSSINTQEQVVEYVCPKCTGSSSQTHADRFLDRFLAHHKKLGKTKESLKRKFGKQPFPLSNYFRFYIQVVIRGGFDKVTEDREWAAVHRAINLDSNVRLPQLKTLYEDMLLMYESLYRPSNTIVIGEDEVMEIDPPQKA